MVDAHILEAFRIMWGPFPEPVMLIRKDRTVLAVNQLAQDLGIPAGIKCHTLNPEASSSGCRTCKANQALETGTTVCTQEESLGRSVRGYWMPLKEVPDVYVHFGIGTAEALAASRTEAHHS